MRDVCSLIWLVLIGLFRSRGQCDLDVTLSTQRVAASQRLTFSSIDRLVICEIVSVRPWRAGRFEIVRPETVIRWHVPASERIGAGKSAPRGGSRISVEIRHLFRETSLANPLWGVRRIHGELLKLGIDVGQTAVAKYMARGGNRRLKGARRFLYNHADGIASMDLFVVPTIWFRLLYGGRQTTTARAVPDQVGWYPAASN